MLGINKQSTLHLIQITDCHLGAVAGEKLLDLDTDESLDDVLRLLTRQQPQIDLLIASGDIANSGEARAYPRFLDLVSAYTDAPMGWLAGNHDLDKLMRESATAQVQMDYIELECWQIIMLNSSIPGCERGELQEGELERLQHCLEICQKPALVFVHHQPVLVGSKWIDQYIISNAGQLLEVLSQFSQVKGLIWGHVHQEFNGVHQHVQLMATPSTCIQFKPQSDDFALDDAMPGYRWFKLHADGEFETGVERIEDKHYGTDFGSSGY